MDAWLCIRIAHSPDPDDAFMFYALAKGKIPTEGFRFEHVLRDIESLNRSALAGEYELTALSFHAYAYVADTYVLLRSGASMGEGYGPLLVGRSAMTIADLAGARIAVPGTLTTAFLVLRLAVPDAQYEVVPFDRIPEYVAEGKADAGVLIHEGQLTYAALGLQKVLDLGEWWFAHTGLPLPLGGNAVRRDLGIEVQRALARWLRESIAYGLAHREEALDYALGFGRGLDRASADRFIRMYVNEWTLDCGERGEAAIRQLLQMGYERGLLPRPVAVEFVGESHAG
ncbi:MAG: ABC transporter substrate-binding protein [Blastocatellia bacterium]|nr:ABC transporter substrate-binding protein [Blastocatellia bacterium]MCS7158525.1 ABC transporter substrate-binding protein [Blastocatellia bacterium]MDW8169350.1 MqnA/MqnD/SBP family protein [Acidobacteriota bacterium]